jgi:hypothetical protein
MLVDTSPTAVGSTVTGAIRQASAATGTSFNYLLATARVESGLNPQAGASTSSARGLFQFIEQTWLGTMKQSGAELGYGRYAAAITGTASGHYQVADPEMRKEILALRNDPTANAVMAGAFTRANADILSKKLGRAPSEGELYIAHFLGAGGAARLISLADSDPNAKATQYFPNAATANSSIFFDRSTGTARTMAQVRNVLTSRYDVARSRPTDAVHTAQVATNPSAPLGLSAHAVPRATNPAIAAATTAAGVPLDVAAMMTRRVASSAAVAAAKIAAPDTAGITSAFAAAAPAPIEVPAPAPVSSAQAAAENQLFHGLFQDTDRTAPVAAVVSQLWTTPNVPLDADSDSGERPRQGGMRDLFRDTEQGS